MNELEDIKLKILLQNMKLDKPESGFSTRLMNRIFEQDAALEQIKAQRILGKGFWLILLLFAALFVVVYFIYTSGVQPQSQLQELAPNMERSYESLFNKIGTVPLSVAGILIASSVLLFIDRFISSNTKIFAS